MNGLFAELKRRNVFRVGAALGAGTNWRGGVSGLRCSRRLIPWHGDFAGAGISRRAAADHSAILQRIEGFLRGQGDSIENYSFVLFALGVPQRVDPDASRTMGIWNPGFPGLRGSKDFKRILNAWGAPNYWRQVGFPPQCRPLGDKDFECD